jgi:hypothetical protein
MMNPEVLQLPKRVLNHFDAAGLLAVRTGLGEHGTYRWKGCRCRHHASGKPPHRPLFVHFFTGVFEYLPSIDAFRVTQDTGQRRFA